MTGKMIEAGVTGRTGKKIGAGATKRIEETKETGNSDCRYHLLTTPFSLLLIRAFYFPLKAIESGGRNRSMMQSFSRTPCGDILFLENQSEV